MSDEAQAASPTAPESTSESAPNLRYCGLIRRLIAMSYDAMLLFSFLFFAALLVLPITPDGSHPLFRLYLLGISFGYFAWPWVRGGQTLGMKAWRIRLEQLDGSRVTWYQAGIRFAVALLAWIPAGFGYWRSLFDPQSRAWHDEASQTRLIVY